MSKPEMLHMQMTPDFVLTKIPQHIFKEMAEKNGLTEKDLRSHYQSLKDMGYELVPCSCEGAQKPPGRCPGTHQ